MYDKWFSFEVFGQLYKEIDLVYGNEPVLFVCKDETDNRFLFMTLNSAELRYVFIPITAFDLLEMLKNKVTMEKTFRRADTIYVSADSLSSSVIAIHAVASEDFSPEMLPDKGVYYELDFPEIKNYIQSLEEESLRTQEVRIIIDSDMSTQMVGHFAVSYGGRILMDNSPAKWDIAKLLKPSGLKRFDESFNILDKKNVVRIIKFPGNYSLDNEVLQYG